MNKLVNKNGQVSSGDEFKVGELRLEQFVWFR